MILGVGIDLVNVSRLSSWTLFKQEQLLKVFSESELADCRKPGGFDTKRLASRFAAKEAFYKALSVALVKLGKTEQSFSLLFACGCVQTKMSVFDVPVLVVKWAEFEKKICSKLPAMSADISLSHEGDIAAAVVVLSN